jgi:hypothetical protein
MLAHFFRPVHGLSRLAPAAGALILCLAAPCRAQEPAATVPELVTDRPDFTESSEVVGTGVVQLESGFLFEKVDDGLRQFTLPQLLVRVGVGDRVELRFATDGYVSQSITDPAGSRRHSGHADAEIGAKVKLVDASRAGVDVAIIPFLTLPTASDAFGSPSADPGIKLTMARALPRDFDLSANLNFASVSDADGRAWEREASLSFAHALGGPFGAYWEAYGSFDRAGCDCTLNTGLTVGLGDNRQADVEIGRGVSGDARGWFVGVGFAVRRLRH